ncbi:MAG: beta-lactamase family protein, partial [Planctomycetes bacterium]|nr:beta-lactamase family protein [Planctomycetota bacterium]
MAPMLALLLLLAPLQAPAERAPAPAQAPAAVLSAPLDVSALLEAVRVQHDLPGMIGLTLERERVVALGATGLRKSGNDARMLATDLVHIGSCTKAMTATLCARLVQQGKLNWESTLAQVLAQSAPKMHPTWRDVTLEQLLQHRSGAPANVKPDRKGTPRQQRVRQLASVTAEPLPAERRGKFEYSNVGYVLAGHMAEHVAGLDFEELIQRELFQPLGIASAGSGAPGTPSQLSQPRGHLEMGLPIEPGPAGDNPLGMAPAGTLH